MGLTTLHVCSKCGGDVPGWGTLCDRCKRAAEEERARRQEAADRRLAFRLKQQRIERRERRNEWHEEV